MRARNKATGAEIIGTVDSVIATDRVLTDSFTLNEDTGEIEVESACQGIDVDWNSTEQHEFEGELMFLDANGLHVKQSEIELFEGA